MCIGLQMYSIRDAVECDYHQAILAAARLGYQKLELFGALAPSPEQIREWITEAGVQVFGAHVQAPLLYPDQREATLQSYRKVGCKNLIIPGHDLSTKGRLDEFIAKVNEAQKAVEEAGFVLGYHNHSFEFQPNTDGIIPWDEIVSKTKLKLEIDTYWAFNAGRDPLKLMEDYQERLIAIHLKDGVPGKYDCPLGMGIAPVKQVYEKAKQMQIPAIVESETCNPNGISEITTCMAYIHQLETTD